MHRPRSWWCALLPLALLGCGGADDPGSAAATTAAATAATTQPTTTRPSTTVPPVPAGGDRDEVLASALAAYGSPGVLAVVRDGDTTWRGAVGDADVAGTPAAVGMRFRAASITKPVMAALTLRLAGAGLVDLDQPVAPLLPAGVLRPDPPVTIRQLLAHTAGIFNIGDEGDVVADIGAIADPALREEGRAFLAAAATDPGAVVPAPVAVAAAETHDRYGEPGETYHYSNAGYQAAGMAIEAMTGRPLADLLRDEVTRPLGLAQTTLAPADRSSPELRGYETATATGARVDSTDDLRAFGNGANGGVLTTADDLATFFQALLAGQVVPPALLNDMTTPTAVSTRSRSPYGLGLARYELTCGSFYGHEGGVAGTASIALADPTGERVVVIAFNQRGIGDPRLPALADDLVCGAG